MNQEELKQLRSLLKKARELVPASEIYVSVKKPSGELYLEGFAVNPHTGELTTFSMESGKVIKEELTF